MDKIYRRPTQRGNTPKQKKDEKARKRSVIMNFRVTPQEKELIEKRIAVTGLPKSTFFIESCLYQTILVKGNIKAFQNIQREVEKLAFVIQRKPALENMEPNQLESAKTILQILEKMYWKEEPHGEKNIGRADCR